MKKFNRTPLATAMGTLVLSGFAASASADANPFALSEMNSPYMQTAAADNLNNKVSESSCGSNTGTPANPAASHDKAASGHGKTAEASCGEGKCGGMMKNGKMSKGMESSCGAMMKGKEGACGMMGMNMNHDGAAKTDDHDHAKTEAAPKTAEHSCGAMMKSGEGSCGAKVDPDKAAGK
jgi:uncharacterized low-complexity protein